MVKRLIILFSLACSFSGLLLPVSAQSFEKAVISSKGTVYQSLPFFSKTVNTNLNYSIYLPPGYFTTSDSFPVFYLLHGLGGDENSWIKDFFIHRITDSLISIHNLPPLIIVMPDGRRSYFINDYQKRFPYETIFIYELIPFIDSLYRTKNSEGSKAIGGLSMGGFGALTLSMRYPDVFSTAIALSAAVRTDSMIINEKPEKYNQMFMSVFGDSIRQYRLLTRHWMENNPLYLTVRQPHTLKKVRWYIDCGLHDYLLPGNEALHRLFVYYHIPHEFHVRPGNHDRSYWKSSLVPALIYTGGNFNEE